MTLNTFLRRMAEVTCQCVCISTGCTVTLCSALSEASCRSLDDERGANLLPEEVGVLVGITIWEKLR
jgi:hypothetical protein